MIGQWLRVEVDYQWARLDRIVRRAVCKVRGHQMKMYMCRRCSAPNVRK